MTDPKHHQESPRSRPRDASRADMMGPPRPTSMTHPSVEADGAERWVRGKSEGELLADLRAYLARLRDDPHNIQDRLRVAAIQLRLGRVDEALVHYEGVVRGYVARGQIMSAIALCERILGIYPDLDHLQKLLAALYARAPRGKGGMTAVTPIFDTEEEAPFVLSDPAVITEASEEFGSDEISAEEATTNRNVVVDRLFSPPLSHSSTEFSRAAALADDLRPSMRFDPVTHATVSDDEPIPLTQPKVAAEIVEDEESEEGEAVLLLTQPKRKSRT